MYSIIDYIKKARDAKCTNCDKSIILIKDKAKDTLVRENHKEILEYLYDNKKDIKILTEENLKKLKSYNLYAERRTYERTDQIINCMYEMDKKILISEFDMYYKSITIFILVNKNQGFIMTIDKDKEYIMIDTTDMDDLFLDTFVFNNTERIKEFLKIDKESNIKKFNKTSGIDKIVNLI